MEQTRLFVECEAAPDETLSERLEGADGLVIDPTTISTPEQLQRASTEVVLRCEWPDRYGAWQDRQEAVWATDCGLEENARLCDDYPVLSWLPRLEVYKTARRYHFSNVSDGEGFKFYVPDSATIHAYVVVEGERETNLHQALAKATRLGFTRLWLHSAEAEAEALGYDLDLLAQARAGFAGELWISGGATKIAHLENLAREGGAGVAIVSEGLLREYDSQTLQTALRPPVTEAPIEFAREVRIV